jgi:hypothetical protein
MRASLFSLNDRSLKLNKFTVYTELEKTMAQNQSSNRGGKKTGARVIIRFGDVTVKGMSFFNIPINLQTIDEDGKPIGTTVTLYRGTEKIDDIQTSANRAVSYVYDKLNTDFLRNAFDGKDLELRVEAIIDDKFFEEIKVVKLYLPAGDMWKGLQTAKVRRYYLLGNVVKALAVSSFLICFLYYAGYGKANLILGFTVRNSCLLGT